jgi:hypothetical protein
MTGLVAPRSLTCLSSHHRECTVPTPLFCLGPRRLVDVNGGARCVFFCLLRDIDAVIVQMPHAAIVRLGTQRPRRPQRNTFPSVVSSALAKPKLATERTLGLYVQSGPSLRARSSNGERARGRRATRAGPAKAGHYRRLFRTAWRMPPLVSCDKGRRTGDFFTGPLG